VTARPAALAAAGTLALAAAAGANLLQGPGGLSAGSVFDALLSPDPIVEHDIVRDLRLPRAAAGAVAGAALAAATVLLQGVTRNRLGEPSTLGLTAGGTLAVALAAAYAPVGAGAPTIAVAFAGVVLGALLVGVLGASAGASPIRLVLAGMAIGLALSAVTAAIQLVRETETAGLFLWGSGSLLQIGWEAVRAGAIVAVPAVLVALALGRALDVSALGEGSARALGQRTGALRLGAGALAALLTAAAVGVAGPLAFAGLLAVTVARWARPGGHAALLAIAVPWGAAVVLLADVIARLVLGSSEETPAGVVCALIGAPALVVLARRMPPDVGPAFERAGGGRRRRRTWALAAAAVLVPLGALASLGFGELAIPPAALAEALAGAGTPLAEIALDQRAPRLCVALLAGACLAASGTVLQGVVRNPLASPELVGVTGGASVAALGVLLVDSGAPLESLPIAAFAGGMLALGIVLVLAGPRRTSPTRLAIVGLAVTGACAAVTALMVLRAHPGTSVAVAWLAGSTYASGWREVAVLAAPAALLLPLAFGAARGLDVLALGDDQARALGVPVARARALALVLGAALAAAAVAVAGAIAFVGLVAPHLARLIAGAGHRSLLAAAVLIGMILLAAADAAGRTVLAPTEIPSGLVVALLGAPYLAWLLLRSRPAG
jgi:ferric hydroxamate transport system permease protein